MSTIQEPREDTELAHVISQLQQIKEDDCQTAFTSSDLGEIDSTLSPRPLSARLPLGLAANQRSLSIESTDSRFLDFTARSSSPLKKIVPFPDPPPSFLHNTEKIVAYDREGRLHYIPKSIGELMNRSYSHQTKSTGTLTDDEAEIAAPHTRSGSAGACLSFCFSS